jgi:hypothetical protein
LPSPQLAQTPQSSGQLEHVSPRLGSQTMLPQLPGLSNGESIGASVVGTPVSPTTKSTSPRPERPAQAAASAPPLPTMNNTATPRESAFMCKSLRSSEQPDRLQI